MLKMCIRNKYYLQLTIQIVKTTKTLIFIKYFFKQIIFIQFVIGQEQFIKKLQRI